MAETVASQVCDISFYEVKGRAVHSDGFAKPMVDLVCKSWVKTYGL